MNELKSDIFDRKLIKKKNNSLWKEKRSHVS